MSGTEPTVRGGIAWSLATFVAARSLTFVSMLVLARLLDPATFGVLAAVLAYVTFLELMGDLGMKATVVYENEEGITPRVQTAFTLNLALAGVLTGVGIAAAPLVAALFRAEDQVDLFRLAALNPVLVGLANVHDSLLLRGMEFRRRVVPQLTMTGVRAVATIALVVAGFGAAGLVAGFLLGTLAWTVTLWIVTGFRPSLTVQRSAVRSMAAYGGWASALEVIAVVGYKADVVVIGRMLGQHALGLFAVAQRLPELVIENVSWNLSIVAFPALSRRRGGAGGGIANTTLNLVRYAALYGLTVGAGLAILAPPLVLVLFGSAWAEAGPVMAALAVMYGLHTIVFPLGDVFKALGRQSLMAAINGVSIPVMVVAMVAAVPAGLVAVVWVRVAVAVVQGTVLFALALRALGLRWPAAALALRPGAAAAVGVIAGAGAARLLLGEYAVACVIAGTAAAVLCGAGTLRLFARQGWADVLGLVRTLPAVRTAVPTGSGT
jgi:PST family polysaccharide transporter